MKLASGNSNNSSFKKFYCERGVFEKLRLREDVLEHVHKLIGIHTREGEINESRREIDHHHQQMPSNTTEAPILTFSPCVQLTLCLLDH